MGALNAHFFGEKGRLSGDSNALEHLIAELDEIASEARNPRSANVDIMPTSAVLDLINHEDATVAPAVGREIAQIARAVDAIVESFQRGGRLIYVGAGTSGRLGMLDAAECPPTFGVSADMVFALIAGGPDAIQRSIERAEDNAEHGAADLRAANLRPVDIVTGIAVSGRTPYVAGALEYARTVGATTIALTGNARSKIALSADISIAPDVGPEVLTGSTRLKAGTAQKLVLNMLSTASMIRMGKCYQNLMVDVQVSNQKLLARAARIVMQATECSANEAIAALERTDHNVKLAILVLLTGQDVEAASNDLKATKGYLRRAIEEGTH